MKAKKGFTLIELSIVIVIIGLIIAGVVGGQSLVNAAKLRTLIVELREHEVVVNAFKLEYRYLPGDIPNANDYWPGCNSGATETQCNGDGRGIVAYFDKDFGGTNATDDAEPFRAWQHLSLAELVPQQYSGVSTGGFTEGLQKGDVFFSKTGFGKMLLKNTSNMFIFKSGGNIVQRGNYGVSIGGDKVGEHILSATISVPNAKSVDNKIDDGVANAGKFIAVDGNFPPVAANSCSASGGIVGGADYNTASLTDNTEYCAMHYFLGH
jgi:prepilin-type N-terminal cleavage/methylation domain-containing protein